MKLFRNGAIGFIGWLDCLLMLRKIECEALQSFINIPRRFRCADLEFKFSSGAEFRRSPPPGLYLVLLKPHRARYGQSVGFR
jgi:hypothetical protein